MSKSTSPSIWGCPVSCRSRKILPKVNVRCIAGDPDCFANARAWPMVKSYGSCKTVPLESRSFTTLSA
ncbi:hypothetical protein HYQ46_009081 [Verticillium longisporum]|nr:hypothetical protein HYQ46_009081 [Verticillium longisporum]